MLLIPISLLTLVSMPTLAQQDVVASPESETSTQADVAIVLMTPDDIVLAEAGSRIRSELTASRLTSYLTDCSLSVNWDLAVCGNEVHLSRETANPEATARGLSPPSERPSVVISLTRPRGYASIRANLLLDDGSTMLRLIHVTSSEGGDDPSVLAVRAVEMVRDLRLTADRRNSEPPSSGEFTVRKPAQTAQRAPVRWELTASVGMLQGRSGLARSFAPTLVLGAAGNGPWGALVSVAGPFFEEVRSEGGTASTRQAFVILGVRYEARSGLIRPFVTVGAGLFYLRAGGNAEPTRPPAVISTLWAPLGSATAGFSLAITPWMALVAEGGAMVTVPSGKVTVDGEVVGHAGAPSLLVRGGVQLKLR